MVGSIVFGRRGEVLALGTFAVGSSPPSRSLQELRSVSHKGRTNRPVSCQAEGWRESGDLPLLLGSLADTPAVLVPPGKPVFWFSFSFLSFSQFSGCTSPPLRTGVCPCPGGLTCTLLLVLAMLLTITKSCSSIFFFFEAASEVPRRFLWCMGTCNL